MKRARLVTVLAAVVLLAATLVLAGCAGAATTTPSTTAPATATSGSGGGGAGTGGGTGSGGGTGGVTATTTSASGYYIAVFFNHTQVGVLTIDQLHSLPVVTFSKSTGETEEGPTLASALALLGITSFTSVTVEGYSVGRVATAQLTLQSSQVTPDTILEFNKQGKTKLAGKNIPESSWIIDVSSIIVQ